MKRIVIAGGGFAGVRLARKLKKYQKDVIVTLINDNPDFRYSPALYRAATGFKMGTARIPLEWMLLDSANTRLEIGKVTDVNKRKKKILLDDGREYPYDYAVFALGSTTTYFDIQGIAKNAYGIKSAEEVEELKHHMHACLVDEDLDEQNFVIIGAGPTGVELSAALGSYAQHVMEKHNISDSKVNIYLVEAGPRILPQLSEKAAEATADQIRNLGVTILTNTKVEKETPKKINTSNGSIESHNVVWTAGTKNNSFFDTHPKIFPKGRGGKIDVDEHLKVRDSIYVIGDNANTLHSGLAYTAINHADFVAKDIKHQLKGRQRYPYKPKQPFKVVPAGERWAVLEYGKFNAHGYLVYLIRKLADIVGYTDVLGPVRAATIWSSADKTEIHCDVCRL